MCINLFCIYPKRGENGPFPSCHQYEFDIWNWNRLDLNSPSSSYLTISIFVCFVKLQHLSNSLDFKFSHCVCVYVCVSWCVFVPLIITQMPRYNTQWIADAIHQLAMFFHVWIVDVLELLYIVHDSYTVHFRRYHLFPFVPLASWIHPINWPAALISRFSVASDSKDSHMLCHIQWPIWRLSLEPLKMDAIRQQKKRWNSFKIWWKVKTKFKFIVHLPIMLVFSSKNPILQLSHLKDNQCQDQSMVLSFQL